MFFPNLLSRLSLIDSLSPATLSLSVLCAGSHQRLSLSPATLSAVLCSGDTLCCSLLRLSSTTRAVLYSGWSLSLSASLLQPSLRSSRRSLLQHNTEDPNISGKTSGVFHLVDNEETSRTKFSAAHLQLPSGGPASSAVMQTGSATRRDATESSKALTAYRSFDSQNRREIVRVPVRSKSVLSAFFVKHKAMKLKAGSVL